MEQPLEVELRQRSSDTTLTAGPSSCWTQTGESDILFFLFSVVSGH